MIALGIFFYVIIYTVWLKRSTAFNIVIGGFAGSAASMAGWATTTGTIDLTGFLVGWLVFMWTPPLLVFSYKNKRRVCKCQRSHVTCFNRESKDC
jgi:heme O synthase-like polyprenyltransferase